MTFYQSDVNKGLISFDTDTIQKVEFTAKDANNNDSKIKFHLRLAPQFQFQVDPFKDSTNYFYPGKNYQIENNQSYFELNAKSLYEPIPKRFSLGNSLKVGTSQTAIHEPILIKLASQNNHKNKDQIYIANIVNGKIKALKTTYSNGWHMAKSNNLGAFELKIDSIPPKITNYHLKQYNNQKQVVFQVLENQTELVNYDVYINGTWQILEYDAKKQRLSTKISNSIQAPFNIEVIMEDQCGNLGKQQFTIESK